MTTALDDANAALDAARARLNAANEALATFRNGSRDARIARAEVWRSQGDVERESLRVTLVSRAPSVLADEDTILGHIWTEAWREGHAAGDMDVTQRFEELADFAETVFRAGARAAGVVL